MGLKLLTKYNLLQSVLTECNKKSELENAYNILKK